MAVDAAHIYWTNADTHTIGRANLNGSGVHQSFITGASRPWGVAVDAAHIYWINADTDTIGRANRDGSGVDQSFITGASGPGVAVDAAHIYWARHNPDADAIGRADLDGTGVDQSFIPTESPWGVAVTPLDTTITAGPSGTVGSSSASFSFAASEPAGFECRLDRGPFLPCSSPKAFAGLANGTHVFYVRARDGAGNVDPTPALRGWQVLDATAPRLSAYRVLPRRFRAARSGASVQASRARVGTRVRYVLSETARVRFRVARAAVGRRARGRCRKPTRTNRDARRCRRYVRVRGGFTHQGKQGSNRFKFSGRLQGRKLRPGLYRLIATASDTAGNKAKPKRASFRIVTR